MLGPLFTDSPMNKQQARPLVDTGALIHGDPQRFSGPFSIIDGYRGKMVVVTKVSLTRQIGRSPP